ncbi:V-snare-domain-containing protein [Coemansia reversa NRRL 1564]|uniref:V-snare-domain-containing protein n=1 Tax=Coemansia reversa (strain ATCC 12441 / NRRL 1564) TaxID=763665 RepID=A0A2G5BL81_COERN|nr:V-snare-domain-containing protein [Coemansia reversa NRRL 1564]|eukprot:PIA19722.1 V-snare-domain-containing protein [Coemansia reversa NRRL 1564]
MKTESVSIELPGAGIRPWEQLLRDVRDLETRFDGRIAQYMQFVRPTVAPGLSPTETPGTNTDKPRCKQLETEIKTILEDLDAVISEMNETVKHQRGSTRVLERHKSMYNDYLREFQRYQANVQAALARTELLGNGAENGRGAVDVSDRDRLVDERMRIDQTHTDIDMVLDQAFSVRQDLAEQRTIISSATAKMVNVTERIPGVNMLLGRIRSRKRREKVVLAIVLATCISILLFVFS